MVLIELREMAAHRRPRRSLQAVAGSFGEAAMIWLYLAFGTGAALLLFALASYA